MKVIFLSTMFSNVERDISQSKNPNPVSGHKFQENLIKGIFENDCDLSVINISRIRTYPNYPKVAIKTNKKMWCGTIDGTDIGFINLPFLNYFSQWISSYFALRKELKKNKKEQYVLITFNSNLHTCFPMLFSRFIHKNVVLCNVVGDLHGPYGIQNRTQGFKGKLIRLVESFQDFIGKQFNCFVFLTKDMASAMKVEHKPWCVVEGVYASNKKQVNYTQNADNKTKVVFYAGSLCREYGIEHLLRSFSLISDPQYKLWLAGGGDTVSLIKEYVAADSRIEYLGFITPHEVSRRQNMATVLVNPRTTELEFVKYSFASKTLECLASGKPYIAHKLPCDPPEYNGPIIYADNESDEAVAAKIVEICELPDNERDEIGQKAREFVLTQKKPKVMCKKIVDMLYKNY